LSGLDAQWYLRGSGAVVGGVDYGYTEIIDGALGKI
jgi:hypothetical protein